MGITKTLKDILKCDLKRTLGKVGVRMRRVGDLTGYKNQQEVLNKLKRSNMFDITTTKSKCLIELFDDNYDFVGACVCDLLDCDDDNSFVCFVIIYENEHIRQVRELMYND